MRGDGARAAVGSIEILEEACELLPHATRAMFGGHGLFAPNGGMFAAVVDEDRIALKLAREEDREAFLAEGAAPWTYQGRATMRGWLVVPDACYDEPMLLRAWCRRAHATVEPKKAKAEKKAPPKIPAKGARPKKAAPTGAAPKKAPPKKPAPKKAPPKKAPPKKRASKKAAKKSGARRG